ncbi:tetratricopeptide repeat protein [Nocardia cerradoensis]|uniref:tetratricopeptide repeat protein n=1 Tax=Nocardia cerradoensis TaxID=85688 RepID=UPI0002E79C41|nr:tetratricopeptide repeat protein [Nocardia cerradoensis]NKY43086.1 sel1 repeat family protein [Nocardia cerradoensis]
MADTGEANRPLAERYPGTEPVGWHGVTVHPMYSQRLGAETTVVRLVLHAAAPPPGLLGLGIGVSVIDGYATLRGHRLPGVDVWSDALAEGTDLHLSGTGPAAAYTLTPVWMTATGAVESWTGNYGLVIERGAADSMLLRCSTGVGDPDFEELVVAMTVSVDAGGEQDRFRATLYHLGVEAHTRGDVDRARRMWRQAADLGHTAAAYDLGVLGYRTREFDEAQRWWRLAAEQGDSRAMAGLAEVLERRGDPDAARRWRAQAQDH